MLKEIKIENEKLVILLGTMLTVISNSRVKDYEKKKGLHLSSIFWDSKKKNLVATNAVQLVMKNIVDEDLIEKLGKTSFFQFNCVKGSLIREEKEYDGKNYVDYAKIMPKYTKYVNIVKFTNTYGIRKENQVKFWNVYYAMSILYTHSFFNSNNFMFLDNLKFDTMWIADKKGCNCVKFKNSLERVIVLVMPITMIDYEKIIEEKKT